MKVAPVNVPDSDAAPFAKLPGDAVAFVPAAGGAGGGGTALESAPSALATATGSEVKPGWIAAAGVTNFLAVVTAVEVVALEAPSVGAAITDVAMALGSLLTPVPDAPAAQGAVTVTCNRLATVMLDTRKRTYRHDRQGRDRLSSRSDLLRYGHGHYRYLPLNTSRIPV